MFKNLCTELKFLIFSFLTPAELIMLAYVSSETRGGVCSYMGITENLEGASMIKALKINTWDDILIALAAMAAKGIDIINILVDIEKASVCPVAPHIYMYVHHKNILMLPHVDISKTIHNSLIWNMNFAALKVAYPLGNFEAFIEAVRVGNLKEANALMPAKTTREEWLKIFEPNIVLIPSLEKAKYLFSDKNLASIVPKRFVIQSVSFAIEIGNIPLRKYLERKFLIHESLGNFIAMCGRTDCGIAAFQFYVPSWSEPKEMKKSPLYYAIESKSLEFVEMYLKGFKPRPERLFAYKNMAIAIHGEDSPITALLKRPPK